MKDENGIQKGSKIFVQNYVTWVLDSSLSWLCHSGYIHQNDGMNRGFKLNLQFKELGRITTIARDFFAKDLCSNIEPITLFSHVAKAARITGYELV